MPAVYVGAGSNIAPAHNIARAVEELRSAFPGVRFSPWYRNRAAGFEGEDFINLVAGFDTPLPPRAVLARLHAIETRCGRPREAPRWAPRCMDLDVLLYGDLICDEPGLRLPRPDLLKRAYMLGPLAALAPQVMHPTAGLTIGELWRRFDQSQHPLEPVPPATPEDR
ncbi:MAG: 2-amino-4-hydroxy-6-hydroxymethyldihydropteridine diphosphokinase [Sinobacteraceae bacterium]|nr:2-amino-4-hydroxy-6-hydroxymethyldihydropteridine diphosphokinase [Nevskiaceae bacterium]MBV9316426.1 2-amino-4-hydroxy-6-hydroxymethyldihydropteridine diphosphokinase [Gammaproteobacteria bacterium]MBV9727229.1 2-amino-4-hydroxy-6-hydroxymethyldihydropteridine diphosphokinase [Gammaproteobacteria bacterium]